MNKNLNVMLIFLLLCLFYACSSEKTDIERGHRFLNRGDFSRATRAYSLAIKANPSNSNYFFFRGFAWMQAKNIDHALLDYNKAIELHSDNFKVYLHRARLYFDKKLFNKSISDYTIFIKHFSNNSLAYRERGDAYYHSLNYQKSIEDYHKTVALDPNDSFACNNLAWILSTCVDPNFLNGPEALNYIEQAIKLDRSIYNLSTYAAAYAENKKFDKAIEIMKEIVNSQEIDLELKGRFREYLVLFQNHKPLRELPTF